MTPPPDVRVCADAADLACRVAEASAAVLSDAARAAGRCSLVLSGGATPRALYAQWAERFADRIPWPRVQIFMGDERVVPDHDVRSNFRMAKETLLDRVPCPAENIHPMPTTLPTPELAAAQYDATLRRHFTGNRPRFDLVLLGLGPEGHTASLFPESAALDETSRWVVAATVPADPPSRLTLTLPALNAAAHVFFLVAGAEKAAIVEQVLDSRADVRRYPAAGIRPEGELVWWVDRDAAARYQSGS